MATMTTTPTTMPRYRFTVADYELMGQAGILTEDDRVELIEGEIIVMSPIGPRHALCVAFLTHYLVRNAPDNGLLFVQSPIRLPNNSEPQPDLAMIRRGNIGALPTPADVLLVVEVSDSTLAYDRDVKFPLYAAAGIPKAWLVDLAAGRIERHTDPGTTGYRAIIRAERGDTIASTTIPTLAIAVDAVLAP
ncbi:MAG: Uma2 family endonuclease, partial [Thermomicrobia bacterium]|nr:Uma2 family endonuclease [Thermomicrobia bacterium]